MDPFKDLNNLYFFARVVDFGSYTAAAEALGLQTSKLSRRVGALESELGVRLLNRTTRKLSLTEAGKTFYRHCVALIAEAEAAKDAINQTLASPRGVVRVSCPTGLLQGGVADILARYLTAHPQVCGWMSSMRQSISRFGSGCRHSRIRTWRCGRSGVRR
jgi:DNA-binding transcriptional LysR family regulator